MNPGGRRWGARRAVAAGDYATVERAWRPGGTVRERGPLVYCAGSIDQADPEALDTLTVDPATAPTERGGSGLGCEVVALTAAGIAADTDERPGWPYASTPPAAATTPIAVRLVSYHLRANRGRTAGRVWLPAAQPDWGRA